MKKNNSLILNHNEVSEVDVIYKEIKEKVINARSKMLKQIDTTTKFLKGIMKMKQKNNEQLCPKCQTGYDTYLLDNKNPFCPYIHCHKGTSCTMFKPLKENTDRERQD